MKNPCKHCVVFAACTKDCREFVKYRVLSETLISIFSYILGGFLAAAFIWYLLSLGSGLIVIWIISAFLNVIISTRFLNNDENVMMFLMAPWYLFSTLLIIFFTKLTTRKIRKRT